MKTVIYADILVVINILVNYLLLRASAAFLKTDFKPLRFFGAALSGGLFSLIILVEGIPPFVSGLLKLIFLFLCVWIAFGFCSFKKYIKCFSAFFLINLIFAGVMCALCFFVFPDLMIYSNGVVYFDINILTLAVCSVLCYLLISVISKITASRVPENRIFNLELSCCGKKIKTKAFFDTGNSLCDSFSGRPVIIADKALFAEIFAEGVKCSDMKNYRLIPYSTLRGSGLLEAFAVECAYFSSSEGTYKTENVYIALTERKIFNSGYKALLGTPLFEAAVKVPGKEKITYDKTIAH